MQNENNFTMDGVEYVADSKKGLGCDDCDLARLDDASVCSLSKCMPMQRSDRLSVVFKELRRATLEQHAKVKQMAAQLIAGSEIVVNGALVASQDDLNAELFGSDEFTRIMRKSIKGYGVELEYNKLVELSALKVVARVSNLQTETMQNV